MKFKRVAPGWYQSVDGRVVLRRRLSKRTYHADEVTWSITVDNQELHRDADTKREAVLMAERKLRESPSR